MKPVLKQAFWIVLASALVGLAVRSPLLVRYAKGEFRERFLSLDKSESVVFIGTDEALDLFEGGQALFLDSRTPELFARGHIPGAKNVPFDDPRREDIIRSLAAERHTQVVIYCHGDPCLESVHLAHWLSHKGMFVNMRIYWGGWQEWTARGLPVETSDDQE